MEERRSEQNDKYVTHSILNYLNAAYQGSFVALNILHEFKYPDLRADTHARNAQVLEKISGWLNALWQGQVIFRANWTRAENFDAVEALDLLISAKTDLERLASDLSKVLKKPKKQSEDIVFLVAAFAHFAYARENYVKGFIQYGEVFKLDHVSTGFGGRLPPAAEDVELSHTFYETLSTKKNLKPKQRKQLEDICESLPQAFRAQMHDIDQLVHPFKGGFSFGSAGFNSAEIDSWRKYNCGPVIAGYWRAYDMGADEAHSWFAVGISEAPLAFEWLNKGFDPLSAKAWFNAGFSPFSAGEFKSHGLSLEEAIESRKNLSRTKPVKGRKRKPDN